MSKKSEAKALKKRVLAFDKDFMGRVKARMKELSKDKKLEAQTVKDLQRKFG